MRRAGSAFMLMFVGVAVLAAGSAQGAPGTLDQSFGKAGKVVTSFGSSYDSAYAVAIQPDGKIVTAGVSGFGVFALARYKRNGTLDPSFGTRGKVKTSFGSDATATSVTLQPDGKILAGGAAGGDFALARYKPNGTLDPTFGSGGNVKTTIGPGNAEALAMAIDADARIVLAGGTAPGGGADYKFALARYNPDGTLDPSFGSGGITTTTIGSQAASAIWGVALQPDGKLVVAGYDFTYNGEGQPLRLGHFELARYVPDGSLDPSFGAGGRVTTPIGSGDAAFDVALQPDGKIVAVGLSANTSSSPTKFALARYGPNGSLDPGFGSGGKVTTAIAEDDYARAVAIQPDGKLVVAGTSAAALSFALARYKRNGTLDPSFGSHGKLTTSIGRDASALAVAIQPNGKIVAAGQSRHDDGYRFALTRYLVGRSPCHVPNVKGRTLREAEETIVHAYCYVGPIKRIFSAKIKAGRVVSQRPGAGAIRPEGTRVSLIASKGKRPPR